MSSEQISKAEQESKDPKAGALLLSTVINYALLGENLKHRSEDWDIELKLLDAYAKGFCAELASPTGLDISCQYAPENLTELLYDEHSRDAVRKSIARITLANDSAYEIFARLKQAPSEEDWNALYGIMDGLSQADSVDDIPDTASSYVDTLVRLFDIDVHHNLPSNGSFLRTAAQLGRQLSQAMDGSLVGIEASSDGLDVEADLAETERNTRVLSRDHTLTTAEIMALQETLAGSVFGY